MDGRDGRDPGVGAIELEAVALDGLALALAALRRTGAGESAPLQIGVVGPTQAGKSTLVNLLSERSVTSVSALAGHTRHARGAAFGAAAEPASVDGLFARLLPGARLTDADKLDADALEQVTLLATATAVPTVLAAAGGGIVWDTPDFDSLSASAYRHTVLAIAGIADALIMIVSRDKYGDLAVWRMLDLLAPLDKPLLLVVNKVAPESDAELRAHIETLRRERLSGPAGERSRLAFLPETQAATPEQREAGLRAQTAAWIESLAVEFVRERPAPDFGDDAARLFERHWAAWVEPLASLEASLVEWQAMIAARREAFVADYERDYLADTERYDTFQRLLGQLLVLLEIPLLARTMGRVRSVVTWPVRRLFDGAGAESDLGREPELLADGAAHWLLEVRTQALAPPTAQPFWNELALELAAREGALRAEFLRLAEAHHADFQVEVEAAARALYARLEEQPALLNGLRAIRASADTAGVVVALQTGGIGLADLVLTPVMLSLTSTLTEGAAGVYVDQAVAELKDRQREAVQRLAEKGLATPLSELGATIGRRRSRDLSVAELARHRAEFEAAL
ncbi:MAG: GTPase domain-containing protein [Pseudomonadota bacterium]